MAGLKVEFKVTSQSNCTSEGRKSRVHQEQPGPVPPVQHERPLASVPRGHPAPVPPTAQSDVAGGVIPFQE